MRPRRFTLLLTVLLFSCGKDHVSPSFDSKVDLLLVTDQFYTQGYAMKYTDVNTAILYAGNGELRKSTNAGSNWVTVAFFQNVIFNEIAFANKNEGYAVGELICDSCTTNIISAAIAHTVDGGDSWKLINTHLTTTYSLESVSVAGDSAVFAAGEGEVLASYDHGMTWKATITGIPVARKVRFINNKRGIIASPIGSLSRTLDGGVTWAPVTQLTNLGFYSLSIVDENKIFVCGDAGVWRSDDFGVSWTPLLGAPQNLQEIQFVTIKIGYAFGQGDPKGNNSGSGYGSVYFTDNGGLSWYSDIEKLNQGVMSMISFPDPNTGYGVSGTELIKIARILK